jgi:hypothetical protein
MRRLLYDLRVEVEQWWGLPHRYSWEKRRHWLAECAGLVVGRAWHRLKCWRGHHYVKFGTWPRCVHCGRVAQA